MVGSGSTLDLVGAAPHLLRLYPSSTPEIVRRRSPATISCQAIQRHYNALIVSSPWVGRETVAELNYKVILPAGGLKRLTFCVIIDTKK